jgi:hypothetical protein
MPKEKPSILGSEEGVTFCKVCQSPMEFPDDPCVICLFLGHDLLEEDPEETFILDV